MPSERSVNRWYIQRQIILNEIALLEEQLKHVLPANAQTSDMADTRNAELLLKLARARGKLNSLGPCPKPMMG